MISKLIQAIVGTNWQVHFSPRGGCTDAILAELADAEQSIFILAYVFDSVPILDGLIKCKKRGLHLEVIIDKNSAHSTGSVMSLLIQNQISVWTDGIHHIMHNKVILIDAKTVITGSFNFSNNAENNNAENLLIIHDTNLTKEYYTNWQLHKGHSHQPTVGDMPMTVIDLESPETEL